MADVNAVGPDETAARVALWRALHTEVDQPPFVIEDRVGLALLGPDDGWRSRPDMDADATRLFRVSIVARARFVEDLVLEQLAGGVRQYIILGAGLDTFAQRRPEVGDRLRIFEIDRPGTQAWKRKRLLELGYGVPEWLSFVPVDFEAGEAWTDRLVASGFDKREPAVVASTGVSMYLTRDANFETMAAAARFAAGSTFAMTFLLPMELAEPREREGREFSDRGARASGTPFISFFTPEEAVSMAREAGFPEAQVVPAAELAHRYFEGRRDGLVPSASEAFVVASTGARAV